MPHVGLVVIDKKFVGETWSNTHGLATGSTSLGTLDAADITAFIGAADAGLTDLNTDPTDAGFLGATSALAAILAFERMMHPPQVIFTRVYVSDGATPGSGTGVFATFPINFGGLRSLGSAADIAPLNNVLEINRVPDGFSARVGHIQFRACLPKAATLPEAGDGIGLEPAAITAIQFDLEAAINDSLLINYFNAGYNGAGDVAYVIPRYSPRGGATPGAISSFHFVRTLTFNQAMSRQVKRGKRRKPASDIITP